MGFEDFEPIFGEAKAEGPIADSAPLNPYLFHVYAPDPSHLKFRASDFRSYTWESVQSLHQLEDMRDYVGIGGSWSEFMDYVISSLKSEDVKLVLEGHSMGTASAKLVAQKSKGLPLISISVSKLPDSVAGEATANLSLELFKAFKDMQNSFIKEQERCCQLTRVISAEQEKSQAIQSQLDAVLYSRRHKLQKTPSDMTEMFSFAKSDTSSMVLVPNSTGMWFRFFGGGSNSCTFPHKFGFTSKALFEAATCGGTFPNLHDSFEGVFSYKSFDILISYL